MKEQPAEMPIEVPLDQLQEDVLYALIESFILREGTDYGDIEITHAKKIEQIQRQLQKKELRIIFDASTETVTFLTASEWNKLQLKFSAKV